jgi:hypothetical protein
MVDTLALCPLLQLHARNPGITTHVRPLQLQPHGEGPGPTGILPGAEPGKSRCDHTRPEDRSRRATCWRGSYRGTTPMGKGPGMRASRPPKAQGRPPSRRRQTRSGERGTGGSQASKDRSCWPAVTCVHSVGTVGAAPGLGYGREVGNASTGHACSQKEQSLARVRLDRADRWPVSITARTTNAGGWRTDGARGRRRQRCRADAAHQQGRVRSGAKGCGEGSRYAADVQKKLSQAPTGRSDGSDAFGPPGSRRQWPTCEASTARKGCSNAASGIPRVHPSGRKSISRCSGGRPRPHSG